MERNPWNIIRYFGKNLSIVVGVVMIWRGIWYILDAVDTLLFDGQHIVTALGGIAIGLVILYVPDRDLKELEKL